MKCIRDFYFFGLLGKTLESIAEIFKSIPHLAPLFPEDNPQRRRFERFRTARSTFIAFRNPFKRDGKIVDISKNGVAFHYFVEKGQLMEVFDLDIFLDDESFYLEKIPCRIVSDFALPENKSEGIRRCGVQFGKLTDTQKKRLDYFLKNHTKSELFAPYLLSTDPFAF